MTHRLSIRYNHNEPLEEHTFKAKPKVTKDLDLQTITFKTDSTEITVNIHDLTSYKLEKLD